MRLDNALWKAIGWARNPHLQNSYKAKGKGNEKSEDEYEVVDFNKDVVVLIILELCLTMFFSNSANMQNWKIVEYYEKLEDLSKYSWAKFVCSYIYASLVKPAKVKGTKNKPMG